MQIRRWTCAVLAAGRWLSVRRKDANIVIYAGPSRLILLGSTSHKTARGSNKDVIGFSE